MVPSVARMTSGPLVLDPLLGPAGAEQVVRIWHDFGSYGRDVPEFRGANNRKVVPQWLLDDLGIERPDGDAELGKLLIDRHLVFPA